MKKTELEYPASHSVDTDWFAVDREGRLANIESGPEGLLPVDIESVEDVGVIADAMLLNSTEIEPGCRYFPLSDRHIKRFEDNQQSDIDVSELIKAHWDVLILKSGIEYKDLQIWKDRDVAIDPLIYVLSKDHHIIHVKHLSCSEESYRDDVENGRIKAVSFFTEYYEELCFSYYPKNEFESAVLERNPYMDPFNRDTSPIPPKFVLSDGFHNIKRLDVSFLDSDEFDLSDLVDTELRVFKYNDSESYAEYYRPCKKNKCRKSDK